MYIDHELVLSDAQAVTSAAISENVFDLGALYANLGVGEDLYVVVQVDTAMEGSSVTCVVTLQSDSAAAQNVAAVTHNAIGTFPATSAAGTRFVAKIQPGVDMKRYLAIKYTPTGGAGSLSAGKFDAFITKNVDEFRSYADGITIS